MKNLKLYATKKRIISFALVATVFASAMGLAGCGKKAKTEKKDTTSTVTEYTLDDVGVSLEMPETEEEINKPNYGSVVTGNIDTSKLVESNGTTWVNSDAAQNSKNVGKKETDTKNDTLYVDSKGTVKQKEKEYEVVNSTGSVIESGKGDILENKVYDNEQKAYVDEEKAGKYVYADANYYDKTTGELRIAKGSLMLKERLEEAKKTFTTNPTVNQNNTSSVTSNQNTASSQQQESEDGKYNSNGTYTIYGLTFESKADFEQWVINDGEGYVRDTDGVMRSADTKNAQKTK